MLDCGAEHLVLRRLDMPRGFFTGNNCVAEHGQLPSNFLLGVSTPASDIRLRRQMRSRLGEPFAVAGNPPLRFASAPATATDADADRPTLPLFLTRVLMFDLLGSGMLRVAEAVLLAVLYICLLRWGAPALPGAAAALVLTEAAMVLLCVGLKGVLVGSRWGADHSAPFWSLRHFAYFFAQDCFFVWCRGTLAFCSGTVLSNPILRAMGCGIGRRTIVTRPLQCSDWNAVSFGDDCIVDGFLQYHTFEGMMLKVKLARVGDGCTVNLGATVMGGALIGRDTTLLPLSLVLKEMTLPTGSYEGSPAEPASESGAGATIQAAAGRSILAPCAPDAVQHEVMHR
jgi:hypothetical protein